MITEDTPLLTLSDDVISHVISFLFNNEVMMFASTCNTLRHSILSVLRELKPETITLPWTFTKALRLRRFLFINTSEYLQKVVCRVRELKTNVGLFTNRFIIENEEHFMDINHVIDFVSYPTGGSVDLPAVRWTDFKISDTEKKILKYPVVSGRDIETLRLENVGASRMELFAFLRNVFGLKRLRVETRKVVTNTRATTCLHNGICSEHSEEETGFTIPQNRFHVPILSHMTHMYWGHPSMTISTLMILLQATPNLEELTYYYPDETDRVTDKLIECLVTHNPHIRIFEIGNDSPENNCMITDQGIMLLKQCNMQVIDICCTSAVTGEVFKRIGEFGPNLQSLTIDRDELNMDMVQQCSDIYFGGGSLPNLTTLCLAGEWEEEPVSDECLNSLIQIAPNITSLKAGMFSLEQITTLVKAYDLKVLNIPFIEGDAARPRLVEALKDKNNLEELTYDADEYLFTTEELCKYTFPSVKIWLGPTEMETQQQFRALHHAFPNLVELSIKCTSFSTAAQTFIDNPKVWPNLNLISVTDMDLNPLPLAFKNRPDVKVK